MPHTNEPSSRHVLGDWGTSRLRLYLIENGAVVDSREGPGIGGLTTTPGDTLAGLVAAWASAAPSIQTGGAQPLRVVLSGMVGSRNGLLEVPYASLPVDCAKWSLAVRSTSINHMNVTIAAGLMHRCENGAWDVMRGEETQIFGALRLDADRARGTHLFVLPGTHSKWVEVRNGTVVRFRTALTGELYALLRDHSILLKAGAAGYDADMDADAGFVAGVERCSHLAGGLLSALFETRTAQLLEHRSRAWASGFLSGLLIGYEIATLSATYAPVRNVTIIGDPNLASLYQRVFADRGVATLMLDGAACAIEGLRCLREIRAEDSQ